MKLRGKSNRLVSVALAGLALLPIGCKLSGDRDSRVKGGLPQGIALAEARPNSLLLWGRCPKHAFLNAAIRRRGHVKPFVLLHHAVDGGKDHTARISLQGLQAGSRYEYAAWCASTVPSPAAPLPDDVLEGAFRTPPAVDAQAPVKFVFGGDIGGQNVCRDAKEGLPAMKAMAEHQPDFFIALGDLIYADNRCKATGLFGNRQIPRAVGEAVSLEDFRAHWRYNRSDHGQRALLKNTLYYALWDDHEVRNDFGPRDAKGRRPPYPRDINLMPRGLRAFLEFNPVQGTRVEQKVSARLYRSFRWGRHLEFFILDNRTYREANTRADNGPLPKTMLGPEQKAWLVRGIRNSSATWKVIVSSVPMSIPTGTNAARLGRDGWANFKENTGFERELISILNAARKAQVRNMLWITTDVHFAQVLRYRPFKSPQATRNEFVFHEVVTGPLSAGLYPNRNLDPTLNPQRLFLHAPEKVNGARSFAEAKYWFNFGLVTIDARGRMNIAVVNANNRQLYELKLRPQ